MTALTQIMEWSLALEQISTCLQAAHISYSFTTLNIAKYVVPISVTYLASRQIEALHMREAANFVQKHLGKLSLIATVIATVALLVLGHRVWAVTTLIYLSIGLLDRYNVFTGINSESDSSCQFYNWKFHWSLLWRKICSFHLYFESGHYSSRTLF